MTAMLNWENRKALGKSADGASFDRSVVIRPITTPSRPAPHRWRAMRMGGTVAVALAGATSAMPAMAGHPPISRFQPIEIQSADCDTLLCNVLGPRIEQLRAVGDEDGVVLTEASQSALLSFIDRLGVTARPSLTLRDDGSLRARWAAPGGEQLSIKFVGPDDLHVALIMPRDGGRVAQWAGFDDADGVIDLLYGHDAPHLLFG